MSDTTQLSAQRIVIYGAGTAGLGIARQLRDALSINGKVSKEDASKQFWLIDRHGLLATSIAEHIRGDMDKDFIRTEEDWTGKSNDLLKVIERVKPTVLIGTSTQPGAFTEDIVREMAKYVERPIIFPVSTCFLLMLIEDVKARLTLSS